MIRKDKRPNIANTKINIFRKMTFIHGSVYSGALELLSGIFFFASYNYSDTKRSSQSNPQTKAVFRSQKCPFISVACIATGHPRLIVMCSYNIQAVANMELIL